jgi:hypothetical protein
MRHRIRDVINTLAELGAELAHDLWYAHQARRLGIPALEQRVTELERHLSQADLRPRARPIRELKNEVRSEPVEDVHAMLDRAEHELRRRGRS